VTDLQHEEFPEATFEAVASFLDEEPLRPAAN
jgi:hypothetical protein